MAHVVAKTGIENFYNLTSNEKYAVIEEINFFDEKMVKIKDDDGNEIVLSTKCFKKMENFV